MERREGMVSLKEGEGGLGDAKWCIFMPIAMRARQTVAFILSQKRGGKMGKMDMRRMECEEDIIEG